jgi:hypothetical protein
MNDTIPEHSKPQKNSDKYDFYFTTNDKSLIEEIDKNPEPDCSYQTFIPSDLIYSNSLSSSELHLLLLINSLLKRKGFCWATNDYLAQITGKSVSQVKRILSSLRKKDLLKTVGIQFVMRTYRRIYHPYEFEKFKKSFHGSFMRHCSGSSMRHICPNTHIQKDISKDISKKSAAPPSVVKKSKKEFTDEVKEISNKYLSYIRPYTPPGKLPQEEALCTEIDLMIRRDQIPSKKIIATLRWLFEEENWYKTSGSLPLTVKKLRAKFADYFQKAMASKQSKQSKEKLKTHQDFDKNKDLSEKLCKKYSFLVTYPKNIYNKNLKLELYFNMNHEDFKQQLQKWFPKASNVARNSHLNELQDDKVPQKLSSLVQDKLKQYKALKDESEN